MMIADNILARPPQLDRLPHRLLYAGEFISIQLIGLQPNRPLIRYSPPGPVLLLVAFGCISVRMNGHLFALKEGDTLSLDPVCEYDIVTNEIADLLLISSRTHPVPRSFQPLKKAANATERL
jgi:hypothetical protein